MLLIEITDMENGSLASASARQQRFRPIVRRRARIRSRRQSNIRLLVPVARRPAWLQVIAIGHKILRTIFFMLKRRPIPL